MPPQEAGPLPRPRATRFLWISDLHLSTPLTPVRERVFRWSASLALAQAPDIIVLGGDMTHQPDPRPAEAFLEYFGSLNAPLYYLPGNYEGPCFDFPRKVHGVAEGLMMDEKIAFLPAGTPEQFAQSVDWLLERLPAAAENLLVFSHFPPEMAGEEHLQRLRSAPVTLHWICGHRHEAMKFHSGRLQVTVAAGLDPVKVRGSLPECLVIDWDGCTARVQRHTIPLERLFPSGGFSQYPGLAFRGSTRELLETALAHGAKGLQFHYQFSSEPPSVEEQALAATLRENHPGAFLSLHLPNFSTPETGIDLTDMEPCLIFAEAMGLDDVTLHLPNVTASFLFEPDHRFRQTEWAKQCLEAYTMLSARAIAMGAQISFENVYNKDLPSAGEERLGSQPWHLVCFVKEIRRRLAAMGVPADRLHRAGIIFDVGHAFADAAFSKHYGLPEWLSQIGPYLQLAHIHQVEKKPDGRGTVHHQAIREASGPLINYYGLASAFADHSKLAFPLLIEVRNKEAALESYRTLMAMEPFRNMRATRKNQKSARN